MDKINVTDNEHRILNAIARDLYQPVNGAAPTSFNDTSDVWTFSVVGTAAKNYQIKGKTFSGVISSLVKKGLIDSHKGDGTDQDMGTLGLTEAGYVVWESIYTARQVVKDPYSTSPLLTQLATYGVPLSVLAELKPLLVAAGK